METINSELFRMKKIFSESLDQKKIEPIALDKIKKNNPIIINDRQNKLEKLDSKIKTKNSILLKKMPPSNNWITFMNSQPTSIVSTYPKKNLEKMNNNLYPDPNSHKGPTPIIAIDCEMVMSKDKKDYKDAHEVGRISIVNYNGHILFDEFIKPKNRVTNYLTWVSGITREKVENCQTYDSIKGQIHSILKDKIIIGHTLSSDFKVLDFVPNPKKYRDLNSFQICRENGRIISLKKMTKKFLNIDIQNGEHSSVEDARSSLCIYKKFQKQIEEEFKLKNYHEVQNLVLNDLKK